MHKNPRQTHIHIHSFQWRNFNILPLFTKRTYVQIYRGNMEKKTRIKGEGGLRARSRVNCATDHVLQPFQRSGNVANVVRLDAPLWLPATTSAEVVTTRWPSIDPILDGKVWLLVRVENEDSTVWK